MRQLILYKSIQLQSKRFSSHAYNMKQCLVTYVLLYYTRALTHKMGRREDLSWNTRKPRNPASLSLTTHEKSRLTLVLRTKQGCEAQMRQHFTLILTLSPINTNSVLLSKYKHLLNCSYPSRL